MITPYFSLSQNDQYVIVHIKIPSYQQFGDEDIQIDNNTMIYHSDPYFLSLTFQNDIAKDGSEKAEIDRLDCKLHVYLPKEHKGEIFPNLDMLPLFLTKKKVLSRVEVLNTTSNEPEQEDKIKELSDEEQQLLNKIEKLERIREEKESSNTLLDVPLKNNNSILLSPNDLIIGEDQQIRNEFEEINLLAPKYGFNASHSEFFKDLQQSSYEIVMLRNPDQTDCIGRRKQRINDEANNFDKDRYISDTFELDNEEELLNKTDFWWNKDNDWTNDERNEFTQLSNIEVIVEINEIEQLYKDLFGIVYAYLYDQIVMGESTVESGWNISILSSVLSYFDRIEDLKELMESCIRRSLIYPMIRNWELAIKVLKETIQVFKGRRIVLMKILLRIHKIYKLDELKHYMNYLFFDEYCIWIQNANDSLRYLMAERMEELLIEITKGNIELPLQDAEQEYIDYINNMEDEGDNMDEQENEVRGYID